MLCQNHPLLKKDCCFKKYFHSHIAVRSSWSFDKMIVVVLLRLNFFYHYEKTLCFLQHLSGNCHRFVYKSIIFLPADDCTNPPVCQNGGFVKQVDGVCSCECVDGLTGSDCTQLDTSSGMHHRTVLISLEHSIILGFQCASQQLRLSSNMSMHRNVTLSLFTFYYISKACFWQNVILIFHYNLEHLILEEMCNSPIAKINVFWGVKLSLITFHIIYLACFWQTLI